MVSWDFDYSVLWIGIEIGMARAFMGWWNYISSLFFHFLQACLVRFIHTYTK
ncbi:hypothetical protein K440DRAFT_616613, partial [Wilcoxina mikolae CBS 423.85]